MINTIEARLRLDNTQESIIDSCVALWSWGYRKTWVLWNNKQLDENVIYYKLKEFNCFTTEQIGSLINKVKTEHSKIKELTKTQLKQHQSKLDNIHKFIAKESKIIDKKNKDISKLKLDLVKFKQKNNSIKIKETYLSISKLSNSIKKKQFTIKQKSIRINRLNKSINILQNRIDNDKFKLCFGSSQLLSQRPGNHADKFRLNEQQKVYNNLENWNKDWDLSRNNIWISIGKKTKPQGNSEIQYYPQDNKLRLRVTEKEFINRLQLISNETNIPVSDLSNNSIIKYGTYRKQARFIEVDNVEFCSNNQVKIIQAINNKQPIAAKIIKKLTPNGSVGFYLQLSFDEIIQEVVNISAITLTMGIDLNQKGLAYCIIKPDGNKLNKKDKGFGFIQWD